MSVERDDPDKPLVFDAQVLARLSVQEKATLLALFEKITATLPPTLLAPKAIDAGAAKIG